MNRVSNAESQIWPKDDFKGDPSQLVAYIEDQVSAINAENAWQISAQFAFEDTFRHVFNPVTRRANWECRACCKLRYSSEGGALVMRGGPISRVLGRFDSVGSSTTRFTAPNFPTLNLTYKLPSFGPRWTRIPASMGILDATIREFFSCPISAFTRT